MWKTLLIAFVMAIGMVGVFRLLEGDHQPDGRDLVSSNGEDPPVAETETPHATGSSEDRGDLTLDAPNGAAEIGPPPAEDVLLRDPHADMTLPLGERMEIVKEMDDEQLLAYVRIEARGHAKTPHTPASEMLRRRAQADPELLSATIAAFVHSSDRYEIEQLHRVLWMHRDYCSNLEKKGLEETMVGIIQREGLNEHHLHAIIDYLVGLQETISFQERTIQLFRRFATEHEDPQLRSAGLYISAAAEVWDDRDPVCLEALESDPSPLVRETAAVALGEFGHTELTSAQMARVIRAIEEESIDAIRLQIVRAVGIRSVENAEGALAELGRLAKAEAVTAIAYTYVETMDSIDPTRARALFAQWREDPSISETLAACVRRYF